VVNVNVNVQGVQAVINLSPARDLGLSRRVAAAERRWRKETGNSGLFNTINTEALHVMQQDALTHLRESIRRNGRPDIRTRPASAIRLEQALVDDRYSSVDHLSITLLVRNKVEKVVPYAHALEVGSRSQIGQERWFLFLSARGGISSKNQGSDPGRIFNREQPAIAFRNNGRLSQVNTGRGEVTDRIVGTRERDRRLDTKKAFKGQFHRIIIRRPVPAYEYGAKAGRDLMDGKYEKILDRYRSRFRDDYGVTLI
jgi:hypothetical protein